MPEVVPEVTIVMRIYNMYLASNTPAQYLHPVLKSETRQSLAKTFSSSMIATSLKRMFTAGLNPQKTVTVDCISKTKRRKNTGEAPMYYVAEQPSGNY